jgi:Flp pilus assembly protein TadD
MTSRPLQLGRSLRTIGRGVALAGMALALAGCLGRDPTATTGSIGGTSAAPEARYAALTEIGKRYEGSPDDPQLAIAYSRALRENSQNAQAVAVLQQAAIRNSRDITVLGAYGKALADAGRLKEAADVLSRSHTPERPDWRILSTQGAVADQMGDFDGAQRYYETALRLAPGEPSILSNQGLSFALAKRLPQAETTLRQAAQNPRADARVRQNLALVLGLEGKFGESEEVLRRDLSPADVATNMAAIRGMVSQPNSWNAIRKASGDRKQAAAQPVPAKVASAADASIRR